jgi:hypothetical protein
VRLVKAAVTLRGIVTKGRADALRGTPTTVQQISHPPIACRPLG